MDPMGKGGKGKLPIQLKSWKVKFYLPTLHLFNDVHLYHPFPNLVPPKHGNPQKPMAIFRCLLGRVFFVCFLL